MINKSVVTIAVGKPYYLKLADNLLKSFMLWNGNNNIVFCLLTDNIGFYHQYFDNPKIKIVAIKPTDDEKSFTSKFLLYRYAIASENLFIDCDCLVYKDLEYVFEKFKQHDFSAIGNVITAGNFFCDVKLMLGNFALRSMPKFVGSIYYFKYNNKSKLIFEKAIELKKNYDKLGFVRLRHKENEEPLFAIAMALNKEVLLTNDGTVKADLMYYKSLQSNILNGKALTLGPINEISGGENIPAVSIPGILHFNGSFSESYYYKVESYRLNNQNKTLVNHIAVGYYILPNMLQNLFKSIFRPLYHVLFGARKVSSIHSR